MDQKNLFEAVFKKRDNAVIAVLIVASLMASRMVYRKQIARYAQLKESIVGEEEKAKALERIVLLNEKIKKFKAKSWDTLDVNTIIERIYNIGLETQTKIRDISPRDKKDEKNYVLIPFSLSCEATFRNLFQFARRLETYPMLFRVRSLTAAPVGRTDTLEKGILLGVTLEIEAVYIK